MIKEIESKEQLHWLDEMNGRAYVFHGPLSSEHGVDTGAYEISEPVSNDFRPMPKIPRLSREIVVTEKIDGTNASVFITPRECRYSDVRPLAEYESWWIFAGSRTRWITTKDDNHGFAKWVWDHTPELVDLGAGHHFGEWWGGSIQRGYGLKEKHFSLFNVERWGGVNQVLRPQCCEVVPTLYRGLFSTIVVEGCVAELLLNGSLAAPGFMDPEGVVVYHTASGHLFKKTCEHDDEPKNAHPKKEKSTQQAKSKDPNVGGRRKGLTTAYAGPERRGRLLNLSCVEGRGSPDL